MSLLLILVISLTVAFHGQTAAGGDECGGLQMAECFVSLPGIVTKCVTQIGNEGPIAILKCINEVLGDQSKCKPCVCVFMDLAGIPCPNTESGGKSMDPLEREMMATVKSEGSCRVDKNTQLSGIYITNDLNQGDVTDIEIISVISEKGANIASYMFNWVYVNVVENQKNGRWQLRETVTSSCTIPPSGGHLKLECSLQFNEDYRHYWQFKFRMGGKRYRINKNNAMVNVWETDNNETPRFILKEEEGQIRINMIFNSGAAYFYCEQY